MITSIGIITAVLLTFNTLEQKEQGENFRSKKGPGLEREGPGVTPSKKGASSVTDSEPKNLGTPVLNVQKPDDNLIKDTVFNGEILELSKEELSRLGFLFDDEGFYYLNRLPNGNFISLWSWKSGQNSSSGFEEGKSVNRFNKQTAGALDFYPIISTDLAGMNLHKINPSRTFTVDSFNIMNDTLVPVLFKASTYGGNFRDDQLLWFKPSDRFFDLVGHENGESFRNRIQLVKELALKSPSQADRVNYDFKAVLVSLMAPVDSLKTLKLPADIFRCMGFTVTMESVDVKFRFDGVPYQWMVNKYGIGVTRLSINPTARENPAGPDTITPIIPPVYAIGTGRLNKVTSNPAGFAIESTDLLIPVQIADSYLSPFIKKMIFWIYPTESFFNCLPPDIARPMRMEYNYQRKRMDPNFVPRMGGSIGIGGGRPAKEPLSLGVPVRAPGQGFKKDSVNENIEPVPCVYFTNLCESIPGLDYVNLYPNPVKDQLNVDLVLQKAKKIRFRVLDLGGRVISDGGAPENYPEGGQFNQKMDVSKLQGGFYLLVMTDEEGARVTRRFVKK